MHAEEKINVMTYMAILTSQSCQCHHCLTSFTNTHKYYCMEESEVTSSLLEYE